MLVNKKTFNLKSTITQDWGSGHKLVIDLKALTTAKDWKLGLSIPDGYKIDQIYGAELNKEGNTTYISGKNWNKSISKGKNTQIVLIVDEGNNSKSAPIKPEFIFANSGNNSGMNNSDKSKSTFDIEPQITKDWNGGYKLELGLTAEAQAKNWQLDFKLPYTIKEVYGADLVNNGNGNYTISGKNNQTTLKQGQSIKPIFIVDDNGKKALMPEFVSNSTMPTVEKPKAVVETPKESTPKFSVDPAIAKDWNGGYKLELGLTAEAQAKNWQLDFKLPYTIKEVYGADLVNNGNGNYTISGKNNQTTLKQGQSIKPIFIVDDNGKKALVPEFDSDMVSSEPMSEPATNEPVTNKPDPVDIPQTTAQSVGQRGKFAYGEAVQKNFLFYEANRSGALGKGNRIEWRSDSTLKDGSDVGRDLTGGHFDAGDHIKFGQTEAYSATQLAWGGIDYKAAYQRAGQFDELLETVKWSTDYMLKAHETDSQGETTRLWVQVGDASDHQHWVTPERIDQVTKRPSFAIDRNRPGSDVAASTASAFASASMLFRGVDNGYADKLLKNAVSLYDFAETYKAKYSDSVPAAAPFYKSHSGYWDELTEGAAWLHRATGDKKYLTKSENYFKTKIRGLGDWTYATDDHSYAAAALLAESSSDPTYKNQVNRWLDVWTEGKYGVKYTKGGFAHRNNWASVPLSLGTAFVAEWYHDNVQPNQKAHDFATRQVDYVLGDNPRNFSYVIGFGDNYPQRPHHRGSAGSVRMDGTTTGQVNDHILYGAVVGGPGKADDYSHSDRRNDWVTNEVGITYNAPFASAAIQQYDNLGGDPLSESQLDQLIGIDADGVGF